MYPSTLTSPATRVADYGKLPLSFEANFGQTDARVKFLTRGNGYSLFLTDSSAVLSLSKAVLPRSTNGRPSATTTDLVRMDLSGATHSASVTGVGQLPGTVNYFIGHDTAQWHTNLPTYARVKYAGVYPGVDLVYYGNQQQLEYDFVIARGADPKPIRLQFAGATKLILNADGDLTVVARHGEIAFHKPAIYQVKDGQRQPVEGRFQRLAGNRVGFSLGTYDHSRELIIDPTLAYSTYLNGAGKNYSNGSIIAVDASGSAYVAGFAESPDFPTTKGAYSRTAPQGGEFVTKFNKNGTALIYSTFFPGFIEDIAVDASGNAYLVGGGAGTGFPVTSNALQTTSTNNQGTGFASKLNATGTALLYSTLLGGEGPGGADYVTGVAVNSAGEAYLTGQTGSDNFPVTPGAFQSQNPAYQGYQYYVSPFVTKLSADGSALTYSTYVGGSLGQNFSNNIAVDSAGYAFVTGTTSCSDFPVTAGVFQPALTGDMDVYVTKVNLEGSGLVYSTFLGGGDESSPTIAIDSSGSAYVAGTTGAADFPVTGDAFQTAIHYGKYDDNTNGFVSKLNPEATALAYSTYLGGNGDDGVLGLAVDAAGGAYVTGYAASLDFPTTANAFQRHNLALDGSDNGIFTELSPDGTKLVYSTYLGGSSQPSYAGDYGRSIALDPSGNGYVTGIASSLNFPVTLGAFEQKAPSNTGNAFVAKFAMNTYKIGTITRLSSSANPEKTGGSITFSADVQPLYGNKIPTGSISGSVDGFALIDVPLDATGHATVTISPPGPGKYALKASYSGDAENAPSGATLIEVVTAPAAKDSAHNLQ